MAEYKCNNCNMEFKNKSGYKSHLKRKTPCVKPEEMNDIEDDGEIENTNLKDGSHVINVYPNPNSGSFTVEFDEGRNGSLIVVDALGRIVRELEFDGKDRIDMLDFESGIYLIQLKFENGIGETRRVVVQ